MKSLYKIFIIFFALTLHSLCVSCEKLIEVDMPANQVGSEQVFQDVQTANAALAGLYASLFSNSVLSGDGLGASLGCYTDDLNGYFSNNTNGIMDIYQNQQLPTNTEVNKVWTNAYQQVYIANSIINGVDQSSALGTTDKNRIKGEALLLRSIIYF